MPEGCEGEGGMCADLSGYQTGCYWTIMFNACCEDAEGQILKIIPAHLSLYFFCHLFEDKRNFGGSPRSQSDSDLSACLLNYLSLMPIWERYTSMVICNGKKHLSIE